jgi:hypothetical protein
VSSLKEAVAREAVLRALADEIGAQLKQVRAQVQAGLDEAQESTGVRQVAAMLPDGTLVAKVSITDPAPTAAVTDEAAFLAWVRQEYPTEVKARLVTEVRPAFAEKLLADITASGAVCDPATGVAVSGVEIRAGRARSHSMRFEKTGRDAIAEAWRTGQLADHVLPELAPPAEQDTDAASPFPTHRGDASCSDPRPAPSTTRPQKSPASSSSWTAPAKSWTPNAACGSA